MAANLAIQAFELWHHLCAKVTSPPEPIVEGTQDAGLRFAWNLRDAYLDVEIYADGTVEWFFKDRKSDQVDGTKDEREGELPDTFFKHLRGLSNRT